MNGPLFLIPILVGLAAQAIKPVINKGWYGAMTPEQRSLPRYGGMPSAHTAFATALATVVALEGELYSTTFMIAVSLVIYVLDDALRMRTFLSRHGAALRKLVHRLPAEEQKEYPFLENRLGHRFREVVAGGVWGVVLTLVLWQLYYYFIAPLLFQVAG